jgi:hypothetical protein
VNVKEKGERQLTSASEPSSGPLTAIPQTCMQNKPNGAQKENCQSVVSKHGREKHTCWFNNKQARLKN